MEKFCKKKHKYLPVSNIVDETNHSVVYKSPKAFLVGVKSDGLSVMDRIKIHCNDNVDDMKKTIEEVKKYCDDRQALFDCVAGISFAIAIPFFILAMYSLIDLSHKNNPLLFGVSISLFLIAFFVILACRSRKVYYQNKLKELEPAKQEPPMNNKLSCFIRSA